MAYNWGRIASGATFHELVGNLLLHEDPAARIFRREGRDGAIDALSGDRGTVFQSKHHKNGSAGRAFADARAELKNVAKYRAGGPWQTIWSKVSTWTLVTNVAFGPGDDERWWNEIVPEFAKQHLQAEYLLLPQLDRMLVDHPAVADAFFGQRPRLFISLAEHREALVAREVLERAYEIAMEGRDNDLEAIAGFVRNSGHQVLLVHGPGGVGKSRLLFEAASRMVAAGDVSTVYCGTPHLARSDNWYLGIVPEAKALVVLDDPSDASFVERFLAELRTRTKHWKVLIGVRTPLDPVIRALTDPRERHMLASPRELKPLESDDAARYANNLLAPLSLSDDARNRAVRWLLEICGRVPIWMTVAVALLERRADLRDLPKDEFEIAQSYIRQCAENTHPTIATAPQMLGLLRSIALAQPINRQADEDLAELAQICGLQIGCIEAAIEDLVRRRVVTAYGIDGRMVEVRPEVLRDHLLIVWLTLLSGESRRPTADARKLAKDLVGPGSISPFSKRMIRTLGRVEYVAETLLLDPIAEEAARLAEAATNTREQFVALEFAATISATRPRHLAQAVRALRTHEVPEVHEKTPIGSDTQSHATLLDQLPWQLFLSAHAANDSPTRRLILNELVALTDLRGQEPPDARRYSDGKAAFELLPRILQEKHGYRSSFHAEAAVIAADMLGELAHKERPRPSIKVLLTALLEIGRHETFQHANDANTWHFETLAIVPAGEQGKIAMTIREELWKILAKPAAWTTGRELCWVLLDHFHSQLNQHNGAAMWRALLENDIEHARGLVADPTTSLEDTQAARRLWRWHLQYERNGATKQLAIACETAYLERPLLGQFAPFLGFDHPTGARLDETARTFPPPRDVDALDAFMTDALRFANTRADRQASRVPSFACYLGELHAVRFPVYRDFIERHLRAGAQDPLFDLAREVARGYMQAVRAIGDPVGAARALDHLASWAGDETGLRALIPALYVHPGRVSARRFGAVDYEFLTRSWSAFSTLPPLQFFLVLGRVVAVRNEALVRARERLAELDDGEQDAALGAMWHGYFDTLPHPLSADDVSPIAAALLDAIAMLPNAEGPQGDIDWEIREVIKYLPRRSLMYVVDLVRRRLAAFGEVNRRTRQEGGSWIQILPDERSFVFDQVELIGDGEPDADSRAAVGELFDLMQADGTIERDLPAFLARIDPHGRVVPHLFAGRIRDPLQTATLDGLCESARAAGWYPVGGEAWRTIASAACARLSSLVGENTDARGHVYSRLTSHHIQCFSGVAGQINPQWRTAIEEAQRALANEADDDLRGFWEWCVRMSERDLELERGRLEEGRI